MSSKTPKYIPKKLSLIHYRNKSYSEKSTIYLPNYEPEIRAILKEVWNIDFLHVPIYSYEEFNKTETKWAQFAREWWNTVWADFCKKRANFGE